VTARDAVVYREEIPIVSPKKLTDTELVLLSAASQREDGAVELTGMPKRAVANRVLTKADSDHIEA